jgi:hypothetical protein
MVASADEHRLRLSPEQPDQNSHLGGSRIDSILSQLRKDLIGILLLDQGLLDEPLGFRDHNLSIVRPQKLVLGFFV